jgi:hypothetical protein
MATRSFDGALPDLIIIFVMTLVAMMLDRDGCPHGSRKAGRDA